MDGEGRDLPGFIAAIAIVVVREEHPATTREVVGSASGSATAAVRLLACAHASVKGSHSGARSTMHACAGEGCPSLI